MIYEAGAVVYARGVLELQEVQDMEKMVEILTRLVSA